MKVVSSYDFDEVGCFKFGYSPFGRPKLFVYIYFIDGLLIDTGQSKLSKEILSATKKLSIDQIFITHHHEDHTGNIPVLSNLHNCNLYASEMTCQIMKNPPSLSFVQELYYGQRRPFHSLTPKENHIKTEKYHFEIIPIPGHAPDMVALYEPDNKWLFSADLYISPYVGYFLGDESILTQIRSIRNILKLEFDVMFCSHNPQLSDGKLHLSRKVRYLESFYDDVSSLYKKGCSVDEIFKRLELKENWFVKILSGGKLSKLNMVRSVIRDLGN